MSRWFRHYAGLARDDKMVRAALRSKQPVERVIWVWVAILESAAEINDNGRYDFDADEAAYFLRADADELRCIESALADLGRIDSGAVAKWGDRQFTSDTSTERVKRFRDRKNLRGNVADEDGERCETPVKRFSNAPEPETEANISILTDGSPKPPKRQRTRIEYSEDYEGFWKAYPTDSLMSKSVGYERWKKLSPEDRQRAILSLPAFNAYCRSDSTYRPVHVERYLSQRRFDGFAKQAEVNSSMVFLKVGSAQFDAWNTYLRDTKGKGAPNHNGGWRFPSEWPPNHRALSPHAGAAA